ncbi:MAG: adenylosuccinate lyase [Saprospiraceae bacterium]
MSIFNDLFLDFISLWIKITMSLENISPVDGRYQDKVKELSGYFSEYALIKYRVFVEIEYLKALYDMGLNELQSLNSKDIESLNMIFSTFNINDANKVKEIEGVTNHDVKAVEYFIKRKLESLGLSKIKEFVHFGLTSQDINNTAFPLMIRDSVANVITPKLVEFVVLLKALSDKWKDIPLLARTHGQPASPTTLGKEIYVFVDRLEQQIIVLNNTELKVKFGGATGNFNAHRVAYPEYNWKKFADSFAEKNLKLSRSQFTTQIDHYDSIAEICDALSRISTILIDFSRDIWSYISMDYFKLKTIRNEVGSSAMPHKVNPIDFENAEGNLGLGITLFRFLSEKLPISRLQRDLTDSTVLRNMGVPVSHLLISLKSLIKGTNKLEVNIDKINSDLDNNWAVVSEAIQTVLRKINYPEPYEALKALTRGNNNITKESMHAFIDTLNVSEDIKKYLKSISPFNYVGYTL